MIEIPGSNYLYNPVTRGVEDGKGTPALTFLLNGVLHARVTLRRPSTQVIVNIDKLVSYAVTPELLQDPDGPYGCLPIPDYPGYLMSRTGTIYSTLHGRNYMRAVATHRRNHGSNSGYHEYAWLRTPGNPRPAAVRVSQAYEAAFGYPLKALEEPNRPGAIPKRRPRKPATFTERQEVDPDEAFRKQFEGLGLDMEIVDNYVATPDEELEPQGDDPGAPGTLGLHGYRDDPEPVDPDYGAPVAPRRHPMARDPDEPRPPFKVENYSVEMDVIEVPVKGHPLDDLPEDELASLGIRPEPVEEQPKPEEPKPWKPQLF